MRVPLFSDEGASSKVRVPLFSAVVAPLECGWAFFLLRVAVLDCGPHFLLRWLLYTAGATVSSAGHSRPLVAITGFFRFSTSQGRLAQRLERLAPSPQVGGSNPGQWFCTPARYSSAWRSSRVRVPLF